MIWWFVGGSVVLGILLLVVPVIVLGEHAWPLRRAARRLEIRAEEAARLQVKLERVRLAAESLAESLPQPRSND